MKLTIRKPASVQYEIAPQVVLAGEKVSFRTRGLGIENSLPPHAQYIIRVIPQEEIATARTHVIGDHECYDEIPVESDAEGYLNFSYSFPNEEIYTLRLLSVKEGETTRLTDFRVFSACKDLWERIPMRGNTHCHTCFSADGHEDPVVAASFYRRAGFDFLVITDHHTIDGSLFAMNKMKDIPSGMSLFCGEEVHVPNPYIHVVNVGAVMEGGVGIDQWYQAHKEDINREVDEIARRDAPKLPDNINPLDWAWRKWIADTIHKNGGIAIIAHPFWEYDAHNTSNAMLEYLVREKVYDAQEVLSGQEPNSSEANMQVAFWHEMRAKGLFIPIVGADDAHRRCFRWDYDSSYNQVYTIVFSKDNSFEGFSEAVKNGYTVAVDRYGDAPEHVVGTYRLTKYAIFLLDQYYPKHDELCFEEGCRIQDAYLGDIDSLEVLEVLSGRVKKYTDRFFGRSG